MRKVLITGVTGFTGRYMAEELAAEGYEVHGLSYRQPLGALPAAVSAIHCCSLNDAETLRTLLTEIRPTYVVHLAAVSFVAHADADAIYNANLLGTRHLLEALRTAPAELEGVLLASSANVYGNATEGVLDESAPFAPANDYAISKAAMEYLARLYQSRLPLIITRPFNYTGVGQAEQFLIPKIVAHTRRHAEVIELGNLDIARDFCDVRQVAQAYRRLLESPAAIGETVNICSGFAYTLQYVLEQAAAISGHSMEVRVNPAFVRSADVKNLFGNRTKLDSLIGDLPQIELKDTLRWMIEYSAS
ncbi:GDP-mannose 4,6-dehydratase [Stutzerimonas zhaodongensis]|uniref:GDP-mannose 4,6-dehydratase n=1 Tax=Stutzerimonas zhaodongensis TaxID=1176257 RepID=UPI002104E9DF|nr:GDP-mannose 4,6-dehydratase [Stutzerimonas zhaodongensis]MCQ2031354.1 GDP-mannose 4,6-dehydratase [Stutzerimonas zhaodongensis]